MEYAVIITARARRDLQQILDYIGQDDIFVARRIAGELFAETHQLAHFPRLGRVVPEFDQENARELIYRQYRIVYRIADAKKTIYIARFWNASRGTPPIK